MLSVSVTIAQALKLLSWSAEILLSRIVLNLVILLATSHPGEKTKELAKFYTKLSEIRTSLGLNYNGLDLIGKRFVWFIYMKRAKMIFYEKGSLILI